MADISVISQLDLTGVWPVRRRGDRSPHAGRMFRDVLSLRVRERTYDHAAKFLLRAALYPQSTVNWLDFLGNLRERAGLGDLPYDLVKKPSKPFVDRRFSRQTRAFLLERHYRMLMRTFGSGAVARLLAGEPIQMATLTGKSGRCYFLEMRRDQRFQFEGELIITLSPADQPALRVANLSLTLGSLGKGDPDQLWIGGLQGAVSEDAKAEIVGATRDLFGARPKQLVVEAAYGLAHLTRVGRLVAVSNASHVLGGVGRHGQVIRADYDTFWTELNGRLDAEDRFVLPTVRLRRSECDVKPSKRKVWRERYRLMDGLVDALRDLPLRLGR